MLGYFIKGLFIIQVLLVSTDIINNTILNLKVKNKISLISRMILSFTFMVAAILVYLTKVNSMYSIFVFVGTIFSFFGDLVMASLIKFKNRLKAGIVFFSATHALYITAYFNKIIQIGINGYVLIPLVLIYSLVLLILFYISKKDKQKSKDMSTFWYAEIIILMAVFSLILAITGGGRWIITFISALIFIVSDSLIAINDLAGKKISNKDLLIWITYTTAQVGIIYSAIL